MIVHTADDPCVDIPLPHTLNEPTLTASEKELLDRFVVEYRVDYDYLKAAIRVGFEGEIAKRQAVRLKFNSYVQRQIAEALIAQPDDPKCSAVNNEQRIINSLFKEANYKGSGSSHGARVSALSKLAGICGIEKPIESKVVHEGGQDLTIKTEFNFDGLDEDDLTMVRKLLEKQVNVDQST